MNHQVGPMSERECPRCKGSGTIRSMTSHLGPDDYEFDESCPVCWGTGSADPQDAVNALGWWTHMNCTVVARSDVLRLIKAREASRAPVVGVPPWIPAGEQLPDVDGRYLVHSRLGIPARDWVDVMYYATSPIGEWSRRHGETVKHWMPLPALPGQAEALQSDEQKERMGVPLSDERIDSIIAENYGSGWNAGPWIKNTLRKIARAVLAASLEKK